MKEEIITMPEVSGLPFAISLAGISYCDGSYKISRAKSRETCVEYIIKSTTMSVKEIAASLCFADEHYFSGFFKKRTGSSPREYRNKDML